MAIKIYKEEYEILTPVDLIPEKLIWDGDDPENSEYRYIRQYEITDKIQEAIEDTDFMEMAEEALSRATTAETLAEQATEDVGQALEEVGEALTKVDELNSKVDGYDERINDVASKSDNALQKSQEAKDIADLANNTANKAQSTADESLARTINNENEISNVDKDLTDTKASLEITRTNLSELQKRVDGKADKTQLDSKQDTLQSGTNIKTINGQSILGPGNIVVQGGEGGGIPEAPIDDKTYGRKNGDWTEVATKDELDTKADKSELDNLATKDELNAKADKSELDNKQDTLESGTNIKTINNESILGPGNIEIESFSDAPLDYKAYGRMNAGWVEVLADAPDDGRPHGRNSHEWEPVTPEAPYDGQPYARMMGEWVYALPEAPIDDKTYGRKNTEWVEVATKDELDSKADKSELDSKQDTLESGVNIATINSQSLLDVDNIEIESGIPDAPDGYKVYGRKFNEWLEVTPEAPADDKVYGRKNEEWVEVATKEDIAPQTPNVVKFGELEIENGVMRNFSASNYAQFPFLMDLTNKAFEITMEITTGNDVSNQQNILDSRDGLAFAIRSGQFVLAVSNNGTSWAFEATGGTVEANTTYLIKLSWNHLVYSVKYSTYNAESWSEAINQPFAGHPYPRTMLIGKDETGNYYFKGQINLNKCTLSVNNQFVWDGMTDAGLLTRLETDLGNIDQGGIDYINSLIDAKLGPVNTKLGEILGDEV